MKGIFEEKSAGISKETLLLWLLSKSCRYHLSLLKGSNTGRVFERVLVRERTDVCVRKREGTAF